ncbi:hypothetical protein B0J13DRAFT_650700 [Dactylonectria estremocensis]|uniref:GPI inositol-deacylase n=1 Tax=Dactylonectria estremocensis TaxID=1079267 RepID=A0A9P9JBE6_9HYPO|nr:hypothetical protein B0J13DRAFT_650700 [Dactylonectria estremocensis]
MTGRHQSDPGHINEYGNEGSASSYLVQRPSTVATDSIVRRSLRSFTLQKKPAVPLESVETWCPYGLQLLHSPPEPLIDFIFVHGLRGGPIKTWTKSGNPQLYWPQAWLPRDPDLQNARIHSFGYNSDWSDSKETKLDIHDFGRSLFGEIQTSPELRKGKQNPILLIGHSMGGLVIKKAYLLAREDESAKTLADRLQCMFFIATPHRGSDAAKMLDRILKASTGSRPYVTDLNRNSGMITSINDAFRHHTDKLHLWSFYETMKTKKAGNSMMVVDRESAVIGAAHEHVNPLNADHLSVCKFESPSDSNYILLKNSLAKAAEDILGNAWGEQAEESGQQLVDLESYLLIQHYPEDDLNMVESKKTAGSCGWITGLQSITTWRDSASSSMLVHWLSGQAGAGKSVLATHLIRHLGEVGFDTCYYFFREGQKAQQTVSGFLRTLAYQMAVLHPSVRVALNNLRETGVVFDRDDELAIWRKVFVQCILPVPIGTAQFWLIDGLDECLDISKLFPLLTRAEAKFPIRLHFSSRRLPELEKLMSRFNHLSHHHIEVEDTVPDIELFIETHSQELPVEDQNRPELVKKLVMKSCGAFLWVELACEELGQVFSEDEIDEVLEHVPAGMAPLYNKILDSMAKHAQHRPLIQAALEWTVCGTRPMTIDELQAALTLDRKSKVHNVRKIVEQLCGQLLRIDSNDVVQMIHGTARDFLLNPNSETIFAVDKAAVHQRIASVCLQYLIESEMRPPRHPMLAAPPTPPSKFANYSSTSWSDHLASSSSVSNDLFALVDKFFRTNVLTWAEYTLRYRRSLYYLTRASKNLNKYLSRRAKHVSPLGGPYNYLQRWATDLLRVALKFGDNLLRYPAAIHFIVPQLCPRNSGIHQQFAHANFGPHIQGLTDADWDDCVCYIDYRNSTALCLASCEGRFAIGMKSGAVKVYQQATCQIVTTLDHGEPVHVLQFDGSSARLASSGFKHVKLWTIDGAILWWILVQSPFATMSFVQDDQILLAVDKSSNVIHRNAEDGSQRHVADAQVLSPGRRRTPQIITSADICPEGKLVALAYRGKPAQIWSTEQNVMIKECHMARDRPGVRTMAISQVLFNPNPAIELLAIAHQDLELSIFDKWSDEGNEIKSLPGDAMTLAATTDGRTLGTGDATGTIKLWDFETLTLLYCIKSNECEVKSLAFSGDGFKLYDIRDTKTKVWEPSALVRKMITEESSVSDSVTGSAPIIGRQRDDLLITYIVATADSGCLFVGRDDGSVLAYDWVTGTAVSTLYTHKTREFITNIASNSKFIASTDATGKLEVYDLVGTSVDGFRVTRRSYDKNVHGPILALEMHPTEPWLLIAQAQVLVLINLLDGTEHPIATPGYTAEDYKAWTWLRINDDKVILLGTRNDCVDTLSLENSGRAQSWRPRLNGAPLSSSIEGTHCSGDGKYVAMLLTDEITTKKSPKLLVYKTPPELATGHDKAIRDVNPILTLLNHKLKTLYGFHEDRVVFLDHDLWIWSIDLSKADGSTTLEAIEERHFFVPREFIGGNNGVDGVVTPASTIVFPKEGELAVGNHALDWPFVGASLIPKGSPKRRDFGNSMGKMS